MFDIWAQGFVIQSNAEVDLSIIYILFGSSNNWQCPRNKFINNTIDVYSELSHAIQIVMILIIIIAHLVLHFLNTHWL